MSATVLSIMFNLYIMYNTIIQTLLSTVPFNYVQSNPQIPPPLGQAKKQWYLENCSIGSHIPYYDIQNAYLGLRGRRLMEGGIGGIDSTINLQNDRYNTYLNEIQL